MHAAIKAMWLTALRSGEYEQGQGYLNNDGKFCCLGVLCDLAVKFGATTVEYPDGSEDPRDPARKAVRYGLAGSVGVLPESVREWAGLREFVGELRTPIEGEHLSKYSDLASLNDFAGYTFHQIADVIEEQF